MRPKVLLTGGTGYIGKYLKDTLQEDMDVFALTKYPDDSDDSWIKGDVFNLDDCIAAMQGIDIAVYFLDPTKRSTKTTEAAYKDMNALAADNYARAAELNQVKEIIYVKGAAEDEETLEILRQYKTPVRLTDTEIKRKGIFAISQPSKRDDVRAMSRVKIPSSWTLSDFTDHYFTFMDDMIPKVTDVIQDGNDFYITARGKTMMHMIRLTDPEDDRRQLFQIKDGLMVKDGRDKGRVEFRRIKTGDELIIATHDYEPRVPWAIYQLVQSPFHQIVMRILDVDMRIARFNEDKTNGRIGTYTKDTDKKH